MSAACLICLQGADETYHEHCLEELFGRPRLPRIDLDQLHLPAEGWKMAGAVSISGLQPKLSMRLTAEGGLETARSGGQFILKPQSPKYRALPENEHATMRLAQAAGIEIPPCGLVTLRDGSLAYIVRRYDRGPHGEKTPQEDFCQLAGWPSDRKYEGSAELCVRLVRQYARGPGAEVRKLFRRLLFGFFTGNGDMHLKNLSLLIDPTAGPRLAPAYDLLSTRLVEATDDLALPVCGKRDRLKRGTWLQFAAYCQMEPSGVEEEMAAPQRWTGSGERLLAGSPLPEDLRLAYLALLRERGALLCGVAPVEAAS